MNGVCEDRRSEEIVACFLLVIIYSVRKAFVSGGRENSPSRHACTPPSSLFSSKATQRLPAQAKASLQASKNLPILYYHCVTVLFISSLPTIKYFHYHDCHITANIHPTSIYEWFQSNLTVCWSKKIHNGKPFPNASRCSL